MESGVCGDWCDLVCRVPPTTCTPAACQQCLAACSTHGSALPHLPPFTTGCAPLPVLDDSTSMHIPHPTAVQATCPGHPATASSLHSPQLLTNIRPCLPRSHDYCGVMEDLQAYWPKLRSGGIFAGHDYIDAHYHALKATNQDWSGEGGWRLATGVGRQAWRSVLTTEMRPTAGLSSGGRDACGTLHRLHSAPHILATLCMLRLQCAWTAQ